MRIAIISPIFNPIKQPFLGGVEAHVWWLATKLAQRGHELDVYASGDSDSFCTAICKKSLFKNKKYKSADTKTLNARFYRRIRDLVSNSIYSNCTKLLLRKKYDVIHNHALHARPLVDASEFNAPVLTTLHTPPFREITYGVISAAKLKNCAFTCVSKYIASVWEKHVGAYVVHNGVDLTDWQFTDSRQQNSAIWFGRITPDKAPHYSVEVALEAGLGLDLYGEIVDYQYFRKYLNPMLDNKTIRYRGPVSHSHLSTAIGNASVMLNTPTWEEPFGLTFLEAMACGTPVVTFQTGACEEIITSKTGRVVKKYDIAGMVDAVKGIHEINRLNCREHVEKNFSFDKMVSIYEKIYKELI